MSSSETKEDSKTESSDNYIQLVPDLTQSQNNYNQVLPNKTQSTQTQEYFKKIPSYCIMSQKQDQIDRKGVGVNILTRILSFSTG